jgi:uncharacterized membrane protein
MPTSLPAKEVLFKATPKRADPRLLFGAVLSLTIVVSAISARLLPAGWATPLAATLLFVLAGAMALLAWRRREGNAQQVNCWDVAGALTLIGICAAATIDPEQMVQLVESGHAQRSR